jgi:nucleoside-diphosphate-sugar epimerase
MNRLFCFGLGFSARALISRLQQTEPGKWRFAGTSRQKKEEPGIDAFTFDGKSPMAASALDGATHLLISIPPSDTGDPVLAQHAADIAARASGMQWIGYLSTTGVYGDRQGDWVDEGAAITPNTERGRRRAAAESEWLKLGGASGIAVQIFRLAGIYGQGRNAFVSLREGRAHRAVKPGQVFSRIHVEDVAAVLAASIARPNPGAAYNLADDEPAPPQDVVKHAADLLGVEAPPEVPLEQANLSPMALSFYTDSKRVRNTRIKQELGVTLKYPTYREGLAALLVGASS